MQPALHDAPRHSYDLQALDADAELRRLHRQVELVRELEQPILHRLGLHTTATVLDLGCGPGHLTRSLLELAPEGQVIGVDVDAHLLAQASDRYGRDGIRFVQAWAHEIPLADRSVDLVYSRFLFQHLSEPARVLRELRRLLRPGGQIVLVDTDDGGLVMYPEPPGLHDLLAASSAAQADVGGDRHVGRKLRHHLVAAGFSEVSVEVVPFTTEAVGVEAFVDITLGFKRQIIPPHRMSLAQVDAVIADALRMRQIPGAFAQALGYVAKGRVPMTR